MEISSRLRNTLFVCLGGLLSLLAWSAPTAAEYGVILNLSGKQRMLSQKISKEVLLVALDVDKPTNIQNLKASSALFDKTLSGLKDGDSELGLPATESKRIRRQLTKVEAIWESFYPSVQQIIATGMVADDQLQIIANQNLPLLKQMNKAVGLYEKEAAKSGLESAPELAVTINLAGKQRMLTQKMSKEFLLIALEQDAENNKLNLLDTYTLFDRTLKGLADGDETLGLTGTPQFHIRQQLQVVERLWENFKPLVAKGAHHSTTEISAAQVRQVASTNLPLLKEMNRAVGLYEQEAALE